MTGPAFVPFNFTKETLKREVVSATTTYVGYTTPNEGNTAAQAKWLICKITSSGGEVTDMTWASKNYDQVWNDRASLTYS